MRPSPPLYVLSSLLKILPRALARDFPVGWRNHSLSLCCFIKRSNQFLPATSLTTDNVFEIIFLRNYILGLLIGLLEWVRVWVCITIQYRTRGVMFLRICSITHFHLTYCPHYFYHVFIVPWLQTTYSLSCTCRRLLEATYQVFEP
jgi:hypothetical protein